MPTASFTSEVQMAPPPGEFLPPNSHTSLPDLATCEGAEKGGKSTPIALELFAGSCKLSKCLKAHGFLAYGIDHLKCKNRVGPCVVLNLTSAKGQQFVLTALESGQVACVPMAPPCGTSSRARERKISQRLRAIGVPEPKPLRSPQYPWGFPWLKGRDKLRVDAANECYRFVARVFELCCKLGVPAFIENPKGSRMWEVPCIEVLFSLDGVAFTVFDSCMHGGSRDKGTGLLHNCPELVALSAKCDGSHTHKKWGVGRSFGRFKFDTAEEAEYPLLLCQRIARLFAQAAIRNGWHVSTEPRGQPAHKMVPAHWKVAGGRQPRGRAVANLLPEDFQVVSVVVDLPTFQRFQHRSGRAS